MVSLADLATRNFTTVFALILMASPVWGLRPMRALRSAFTRRPMPGMMKTPSFLVYLMAVSASRSRKAPACLLVSSIFSASCRVRAVLVNPVAIFLFSFWACPQGCLCCLGFAASAPSESRTRSHQAIRMEGVRPGQLLHETPVFMRVLENPVVRNNAAWERPKSMEKQRFSTIFLGFCAILSHFCLKTADFARL